MNHKAASLTPEQALAELEARYEASVTALRKAIGDYIDHNTLPDTEARAEGLFVYPQLSVSWDGADHKALKTRAWGRFTHAGCYTTTITNPKLFRHYLLEQLTLLYQDYGAHISVELSQHEIPYPYVIDGSTLTLDRSMSAGLTRYFPTTELSQIGDETADGLFHPTEFYPLSHFDARRVDFSLARLRHYTGTPAEHFQPYVLFTNYTRYVDEFVNWPLFCQIFRNLKKRFPLLYDKYSLAGYLRVLILWLICKNSTANSAHPHKEQDKKKYYKDIH